MSWKISTLLCVGLVLAVSAHKRYNGFSVVRTQPLTVDQTSQLRKVESSGSFDFWKSAAPNYPADIMASPEQYVYLTKLLNDNGIGYETMVEDVQAMIDSQVKPKRDNQVKGQITWEDYYSHTELNDYIDGLAGQNDWVNTVSIGQSLEGRDMRVIQITKAGEGAPNVWIEAGIHAREWIAPAMATYIINELLADTSSNTSFINHLNFHIIPSANPDGYEYSREHDRMWRKTRSNHQSIFLCKGVDGNRNWDVEFGNTGSSNNKCVETYHGPEAFSEVEMRNIRDYVLTLDPVPTLAQCLHSYSQLWLYPYGYAHGVYPPNVEEIRVLGEEAVAALEAVHGTQFTAENSADLYPASGASDDWYKKVLGARFAYTVELRDTGRHGFILPTDEIIPSGEELWAAQSVVFQRMIDVN